MRPVMLVAALAVCLGVAGCTGNEKMAANAPSEMVLDCGNGVKMTLVYIPAGEFLMGSPAAEKDRDDDEGPQHRVRITRGFHMAVHEVTHEQYEAVMGENPSHFKGANLPVEQVSWNDAVEFCKRLSAKWGKTVRLPTEAEWEYACRAGTTTPFYFGETISTNQANYDGDFVYGSGQKGEDRQKTMPVGSFPPNAFGLHDMHGNVWEWCGDWYDSGYYRKSPPSDPQGPETGESRVIRSGSWSGSPNFCRSADRAWLDPSLPYLITGFRVMAPLPRAK